MGSNKQTTSSTSPSFYSKKNIKTNSSKKIPITPKDINQNQTTPFIYELIQTGKPNWSKAPPELKQRYKGIFLVLLGIPLMFIPTMILMNRLQGKSTKKVQIGEQGKDGIRREFSEQEKWTTEKNSIMYKLFGKDFFLDGFTSKTMKNDDKTK
ncbi:unnamed protein product [Candida verbasci]|uniref:Uncharacterized protein n=1 Tax=Candida verbasci TaxID=1227364 RepID=A0A9W4TTA1_9ASCO|nr:unnamed protein product [Candida verbasci]